MEGFIQCSECQHELNPKGIDVISCKMIVDNVGYECVYFICEECGNINIFSVDNSLTSKKWKELQKNNLKLNNYVANGCKISKKMKNNNIKLRLSLNLLRQTLYNKLLNQDYQLLDENNNIIKTGIFKLPNI